MGETQTFLTDTRREILNGSYEGEESTKRSHKSKTRTRARTALNEIIAVADSGEIDNADTFDADQIYQLLVALTIDRNTFGSDDPDNPQVKHVDDDFRREILEAVDEFRVVYHQGDRPKPDNNNS